MGTSKGTSALLTEIEAALLVKMSPALLRWFTEHPPKPGTKRKLLFTEDDGEYFYKRGQLLAFDAFLNEPWPHKPNKRPRVPAGIRREITVEAHAECAVCHNANDGEAAHIVAVATSHNNHPHNLLWLCPSHHTAYDHGHRLHATLKKDVVAHIKETLLEGKLRLWRIERRAARPLLLLIQDFQDYRDTLAADIKATNPGFATRLRAVAKEIKTRATKVDARESVEYKTLANSALKAVKNHGSDVNRLAKLLGEERDTFLKSTAEVVCPLCDGRGFFHNYDDCPVCAGVGSGDKDKFKAVDLTQFLLVTCKLCEGRGHWAQYDECPVCHGNGEVERGVQDEIDFREFDLKPCPICKGKGHYGHHDECDACGGRGEMERRYADAINVKDYALVKCPSCRGKTDFCKFCGGQGEVERRFAAEFEPD